MIDYMSEKIPVGGLIDNQFEFNVEGRPILKGNEGENKLLLNGTDVAEWEGLPGKKAIATMYAIHLFNQFKRIDAEYLTGAAAASTLEVILNYDEDDLTWSDVMGNMDFDAITDSLFQLANEQMNVNDQFLVDNSTSNDSSSQVYTFDLVFEPGEFSKRAEFKFCSILNRVFNVSCELFEKKQAVSESLRVRKAIEFKKLMVEFQELRREIYYAKQMADSTENRASIKSWNTRLGEIGDALFFNMPHVYPGHEEYVNQFDRYHPGVGPDAHVKAEDINVNTVLQQNPLWDVEVRQQIRQLFPVITDAINLAKVSAWNRNVVDPFIASEQSSPLVGYVYRFGIPIRHSKNPGSTRYMTLHKFLTLDRFCTSLRTMGCKIADEPITLRTLLITFQNTVEQLYYDIPVRMYRNNMWKAVLKQISTASNGTLESAWEEDWSEDQPGRILFDWYNQLGFFDLKNEVSNQGDYYINIESIDGAEIKGPPTGGLEKLDFETYLAHLEGENTLIYDRRTAEQMQQQDSDEGKIYATQILAKLGYVI